MENGIKFARARRTRELLETADAQLARAYRALSAEPPRYGTAAASLVDGVQTGVRAFLTWHGGDWMDGAPLSSRVDRAVSLASILRTPLRRARKLVPVAERLQDKGDTSLSIRDREAVLEGFYAVRNLYFTLLGELPPAVCPEPTLSPRVTVQTSSKRSLSSVAKGHQVRSGGV